MRQHPEIQMGVSRTIKGISYKTLVRTKLPTVGFRAANDGGTTSPAEYENRTYEAYILNPRWEVDKAVADSDEDGAEALMAREGTGYLSAAFAAVAGQFYYGAGNDPKGFAGLLAAVHPDLVVDAKWGVQDVIFLYGNKGEIVLSDIMTLPITGKNSKTLTGYVQEIAARPGLQIGNKFACGRIKNLTTQTGKTLDDDMIAELMSKFPVGFRPDCLFMNRRSLEQLRKSRTATNPTGQPAPTPTTTGDGLPIYATDSIKNTESVAA